mmetsp:Transcript_52421/g.90047  ORF Transcript_52421/g.90047 Transcript_52421/m.90047 type:complete len:247 (+) Transcript_52421:172-912(+)
MCDRLAPDPKQGSFGIAPRVTQSETSGGPGPGQYPIKSAVGDTFQFSMRGREKFGAPTGKSDDPTTGKEPGPGQYPKAIEFLHSEEPTPPAFSVPRSVRPGLNKVDRGVRAGPGKPLVGSCGKQVESKKSTQGFAVFGNSKRKPLQEGGSETGPGEYEYDDGIGDQVDSRRVSAPRPTMKGVGRDKAPIGSKMGHDQGPGPQQYVLQSATTATIGQQTRSAYAYGRAAPSVKMSGRTKFGDPFAKW